MKKRISVTIDENVTKYLDMFVDGIRIRSRSHAVEEILRKHLIESNSAVILAGGNPENLFIPQLETYRPLVDIGGRTLIEDIILKARSAGFHNLVIVGSPIIITKIHEVLGDGSKYRTNLKYVEEQIPRGSAKTLELAKTGVTDDFLFLPCDTFFDFDLKKLYEFHLMQTGVATLAIYYSTRFDPRYGFVRLDGSKIIEFVEKPKKHSTPLVSSFIGFMKKEIFSYIPSGEVRRSLQENIFPRLAREGKLFGYPVAENWVNVHGKEDVKKVIKIRSES